MFQTRTGSFPIGFRRGWSDWQKDITGLLAYAKSAGFSVIDLSGNPVSDVKQATEEGFRIGSVDLQAWGSLTTADTAKRKEGLEKNEAHIAACSALGAKNFFAVILPDDPAKPRKENFELLVEGLKGLAPILEKYDSKLVIEGWPGQGALCCSPETYRAAFKAVPSKSLGVNFDPSHLLRMGIDPVRFLKEFVHSVFHVHGKDCFVYEDMIYELGTEQPAAFAEGHGFGAPTWRYTIPGHGNSPWPTLLGILNDAGYKGAVSIELEDENFNTGEAGEKAGLKHSAEFLQGC